MACRPGIACTWRVRTPLGLVFTAEEVWGTRYSDGGSVHLLEWPDIGAWTDERLAGLFKKLRDVRSGAFTAIERQRTAKVIGSGLEADVWLSFRESELAEFTGAPWSELLICSEVTVVKSTVAETGRPAFPDELPVTFVVGPVDFETAVSKTLNHKCGRCWRHLPEVTEDGALCDRCEGVVNG